MKSTVKFPKIGQSLLRQFIPNIGSILIMAAMLFVYDARAASLATGLSPSTLSYQGTLATASGTPVNGTTGMTFSLYNVQSGGTALWTESHTGTNSVPVNNGLFHVLLGSVTPIPSSVWENSSVYLGVQVEGDSAELSPREVVSAVPSAITVAHLTIPDGSITKAKLDPNIKFVSNIFSATEDSVVIPPKSWVTLVCLPVTLDRDSSVMVATYIRALNTKVGDQFAFDIVRDSVDVSSNIHLEGALDYWQYFTFTMVDTNVPAGTYTYCLKVYMANGNGSTAHNPSVVAIPFP